MLKNQVDIQNFSLNLQKCEPLNASNLHVLAAVAKGQLISEDFFYLQILQKSTNFFAIFCPGLASKNWLKQKIKALEDTN